MCHFLKDKVKRRLLFFSLVDTYSDDFGNIDFRRSQNGSGMSKQAQVGNNESEVFVDARG